MKVHTNSADPSKKLAELRRRKLSGDQARRIAEIRSLYAHAKCLAVDAD